MSIRGKYAIAGVGVSRFGKVPGTSAMGFTLEAAKRAIEDCTIDARQIDGVLVMMPAVMGEQHGWAARVAAYLGLEPTYSSTMDMGGATAIGMVAAAAAAIEAGYCNAVLCAFATQNMPLGVMLQLFGSHFQIPYGDVGAITFMGHLKRRQQHEFGWKDETYGRVAVTWRKHASMNPDAQKREPFTLEEYFASKWVVEPLRLLDCCPVTDGGGAVIVTSLERARDLAKKPAAILGAGQSHSSEVIRPEGELPRGFGGAKAADMAYRMAGISARDVDVVQIYDAFTPRVLHDLVAYGFCAPEEVNEFVAAGNLELTGTLPANTAGGLLSEGHLSGFGHLREAVKQIRGEAGPRQVKDVEISMATGYGGAPHEAPPTVSYSCLVLGK